MSSLKDKLIKLGSRKPSLRNHIRPVLDKISDKKESGTRKFLSERTVQIDDLDVDGSISFEYDEEKLSERSTNEIKPSTLADFRADCRMTLSNYRGSIEKRFRITYVKKRYKGTYGSGISYYKSVEGLEEFYVPYLVGYLREIGAATTGSTVFREIKP